MAKSLSLRTWSTPLTIGSFVLMSITGVLMFFEWNPGLVTVVHQWFSWFFLLGAGGHIAVNIRPFKAHLRSTWGKSSVTMFALILVASFFSWGLITGPQLEQPIEEALIDAPLFALANTIRTDPDALLLRLKARGIPATSQQSIRELSTAHSVGENELLGLVFLPE
ncbi:hypothetical protein HDIA_0123 [Hartmannibacter diazotrophicus]|uniref:Flavinylation-associated cytochrome domain-containing protein n=1 Tax=Hartmannibacter diazotrophicus TaxID=1482074 RepID=A0A2C9D097_9HYPH|nr:DUF4405 domain-containing protein [Hartmannibacter diazotrophicus]SON53664.1 hypothetical protein HDIA_0123 [Hartmannibacter diazotrophicus]